MHGASSVMEDQIQDTLDSQWDALESRDKNIVTIRQRLGRLLNELAIQKDSELRELNSQIASQGNAIRDASRAASQREELKRSIQELQKSEVAQKLDSLNTRIQSIDKKIESLIAEKKQCVNERADLESVYSSRSAKYVAAIADIDEKYQNQIDQLPVKSKSIEKMEAYKQNVYAELEAAKNGALLWQKVCSLLAELDDGLKECGKNQLPQISFMLTKAISNIEQCLNVAVKSKWSALSIAITHELQLLQVTLGAVKNYDQSE